MEMAGDLVCRMPAGRQMDEAQAADHERIRDLAAKLVADLGIMIAGHPDPAAILLQDTQSREITGSYALARTAVVQAVAEG